MKNYARGSCLPAGAVGLLLGRQPTLRGSMIIYAVCLVVGLLFTLISAVAGHFFGGHDGADVGTGGHAEAGFDSSGVPGISFFSPTVMSTLVTAFGAFGLIFSKIDATQSPWLSAPLALAGGGIVSGGLFMIFNTMFKKTQC